MACQLDEYLTNSCIQLQFIIGAVIYIVFVIGACAHTPRHAYTWLLQFAHAITTRHWDIDEPKRKRREKKKLANYWMKFMTHSSSTLSKELCFHTCQHFEEIESH